MTSGLRGSGSHQDNRLSHHLFASAVEAEEAFSRVSISSPTKYASIQRELPIDYQASPSKPKIHPLNNPNNRSLSRGSLGFGLGGSNGPTQVPAGVLNKNEPVVVEEVKTKSKKGGKKGAGSPKKNAKKSEAVVDTGPKVLITGLPGLLGLLGWRRRGHWHIYIYIYICCVCYAVHNNTDSPESRANAVYGVCLICDVYPA